ncbi:hypothetical protein PINS_up008711 [Pythium insidiosum]|nr:hypothetical protein PINS_up008711 [Pythium insidiosum]
MVRQIEDGKRDQQYETERAVILMHFLRTVSRELFSVSENATLVHEFDLERPHLEDDSAATPMPGDAMDSFLSPELLQKKRDLRKKVLMDKAMKKFSQMCHSRAEIIALELTRLTDNAERLRTDLEQAESKIDSDQLHIRTLEAEVSKLRLTVDVGKNNLARTEKALVRPQYLVNTNERRTKRDPWWLC